MADIAVTANSVAPVGNATINRAWTANASTTAGQVVYLNASNKWVISKGDTLANTGGAGKPLHGFALHSALANQPLAVQTDGQITGFTFGASQQGRNYVVSGNTAGNICPTADNNFAGVMMVTVGVSISGTDLLIGNGIVHPGVVTN